MSKRRTRSPLFFSLTDPHALGLVFDTGHYAYGSGGADVVAGLERFKDRIWYIHFKDCQPEIAAAARAGGWDYFEALRHGVFCELGKGCVDFPAVLRWLKQHWLRRLRTRRAGRSSRHGQRLPRAPAATVNICAPSKATSPELRGKAMNKQTEYRHHRRGTHRQGPRRDPRLPPAGGESGRHRGCQSASRRARSPITAASSASPPSAAEIFADPGIDAVLICSSTDTHAGLIVEAARAGKHIFCEKPDRPQPRPDRPGAGSGRKGRRQAADRLQPPLRRQLRPRPRSRRRTARSARRTCCTSSAATRAAAHLPTSKSPAACSST